VQTICERPSVGARRHVYVNWVALRSGKKGDDNTQFEVHDESVLIGSVTAGGAFKLFCVVVQYCTVLGSIRFD
jgi:hypothetical protein